MNKKILVLLALFFTGFAFSQTTVTLEDQCDCQVLSGTAVSAPGVATPTGADTGDIYVNTSTGVIYFWDGDSWELTAPDNQQLSIDATGTVISLDNGGSVTINPNDADPDPNNEIQDLSQVLTEGADAGGVAITNLGAPANDADASTKKYVDDQIAANAATGAETVLNAGTFITITGSGTVADPYVVSNSYIDPDDSITNEIQNLSQVLVEGADAGGTTITNLGAPANDADASTKKYVDDQIAASAALDNDIDDQNEIQDLANVLGEGADANGTTITNLGAPANDADASTKKYVDDQIAASNAADNDTDDQNEIQDLSLTGDQLSLSKSSVTIDLGTVDNQIASDVPFTPAAGLSSTDTQAAIEEVQGNLTQTVNDAYNFYNTNIKPQLDADNDGDPNNELNTSVGINAGSLEVTDAGGTKSANLVSTDANNNIVPGSDGGLYLNVASVSIAETNTNITDNNNGTFTYVNENGVSQTISKAALSNNGDGTYTFDNGDGTAVTFTGTDNQNAADVGIADAGSNFTATDVEGALAELAASNAADNDTDDQNEIQDLASVLTKGADADGKTITNLGAPSNDADASTKKYVDDQIAANAALDNDTDDQNEIQDLKSVLAKGNSADGSITDLADPVALTDAANKKYVDEQIVANAADGSETKVNAGTNISVSGSGTIADPYVVNNTYADPDNNSSNEIQNLSQVLTEGADAGGTTITNLGAPANDADASTKKYVDDQIAASAALDNDIDDQNEIQDLASVLTKGADANGNAITNLGAPTNDADASTKKYVDDQIAASNAADNDTDATNEFNTAVGMNSGSLEVTDGGGTKSANLISADANNNIASGSDGGLYLNVASVSIAETNTNITDNNNGTFTYVNENGVSQTISKAALSNNGDGTYTFDNGDGTAVNFTGTDNQNAADVGIADAGSNFTATDVEGALAELAASNAADNDTDDRNEIQTLTSNDGSVSLTKTGDDYDLSVAAADGSETKVSAGTNVSVTGSGTIADPYVVNNTYNDPDNSDTNEIQDLSDVLTEGNSAGNSKIEDLADPTAAQDAATKKYVDDQIVANAADGSETSVTAGTNVSVTGSGTTADPYVVNNTYADPDNNATNELQDLANVLGRGNSAGNGKITDLDTPTANGDAANKAYVDAQIAANAADGSETEITAGTNISVSGVGTSGSPYVISNTYSDPDADASNEIQDLSLSGNTLSLSKSAATADLSAFMDNTDSQQLTLSGTDLSIDNGNTISLSGFVSTDDQNISGSGLSGNILTIGIENGTSETVDLSSLVGTDNQALSIDATGKIISLSNGGSVTINADDADADATNELAKVGPGTPASQGATASNVGETFVDTTSGQLYVWDGSAWAQVGGNASPDADPDPTNEYNTAVGLSGTSLTITDAGGTLSQDLNGVFATDAELSALNTDDADADPTNELTKVGPGTPASQGVTASNVGETFVDTATGQLYVWDGSAWSQVGGNASPDADPDPLNEIQTISRTGTDITLSNGGGTVSVADDDNDSANEIQDLSLTGDILSLSNDATTVDLSAYKDNTDNQNASQVGFDDSVANLGVTSTQAAIEALAAGNAADNDTDASNELNTAIGLSGTSLTITDAGGTLSQDLNGVFATDAELAALNTDDADPDPNNELQTLDQVLTRGNNAGDTQITNLAAPTADKDAANKKYVDDQIVANAADGSETKVSAGTNVSVTGSGTIADPYVVNNTYNDPDNSDTNEIQDLSDVLTEGNSAGNSKIADLADPTAAQDAATKKYVDDQIVDNAADGSETSVTAGTNISVSGSGTTADPYVVNNTYVDPDNNSTNEIQDLSLTGDILSLSSDATTVDLSAYKDNTDDQNASEVGIADAGGNFTAINVEGALAELAASNAADNDTDATNELNSAIGLSGTSLTITDAGGTLSQDLNGVFATDAELAALNTNDADPDPNNEIQNLSQVLTVGASAGGTSITNLGAPTNDADASTKKYVDDQIAASNALDNDTNASNELQTISRTGTDITLSNGGGTVSVADNDNDDRNEIQTLTSNDGSVSLTKTGDDYDLSVAAANGSETKVSAGTNVSVTGSGTIADPYIVNNTYVDPDNSDTNELQDLANVLGRGNSAGNIKIADLADPTAAQDAATKKYVDDQIVANTADGSETSVTAGTNISVTGSGTTADPYVVNNTYNDLDNNPTNEWQNASQVAFTPAAGLSSNNAQSAIEEVQNNLNNAAAYATTYIDNKFNEDPDRDVTNEIQVLSRSGSTISLSRGGGSVSVDDADNDPNNEIELPTGGTNGQVLSTDGSGNYTWINDNGGSDDQNLSEVLAQGNSAGNGKITNLANPTDAQDAATKAYVDSVADDDVSVTNTVAGKRIATISEPGITPVDINETVTGLAQNTTSGDITYTNENGAGQVAHVVSTNANNEISVGTDGGAMFKMNPTDVNGNGTNETSYQAAIDAIAPITAKAARIFYPPSIAVDASTTGTGRTLNLYTQYTAQYGTPAVVSAGAPAAIPTYASNQLYYYVTYYDPAVFANVSIDANGQMTYDVIATPSDYNSLINVVFVVK